METYLVGGAIRDELLGLPPGDRDWVVVGATPRQMLDAGFRPVGRDFPVFLHPHTGEEHALARTERKSGRGHRGFVVDAERGGRWDGPINMCVAEKEFKIAGVNDCFARGFQRAGFQEYDTGEQANWMVQLTDEAAADAQASVPGQAPQ